MSRRAGTLALLCLLAGAAAAHTRSESWSEWHTGARSATGIVTVPAREVTRLPEVTRDGEPLGQSLGRLFADYLAGRVVVRSAEGPCALIAAEPLTARAGYVRVELRYDCHGPPESVRAGVLFDRVQGHTHFARQAGTLTESLIREGDPEFRFHSGGDARSDDRASFDNYLQLGITHILSGPDHIAFLLALLLAAARWRNVVIAVTGFTIGHSVTLSLAVTGLVQASPPRVEAFIGYTIALVAAETVALRDGYWRRLAVAAALVAGVAGIAAWALADLPLRGLAAYAGLALFSGCYLALAGEVDDRRRRSGFLGAVAILFGLIHGLGFAGFLLQTGLPEDAVALPLVAFNIGVELGQLMLVAAVLVAAAVAGRLFRVTRAEPAETLLAAVLCGLGLAWFAGRSLG
ncbi:HupE/UreJ family protein [Lentisalinibacter salinarum]|uniref:HupE/UreJ family protein n=1 Tax=Lentisalinibacter salinarum TaxID=2992239 RepID=UPI00386F1035